MKNLSKIRAIIFRWQNANFLFESEISPDYLYLASKETLFRNGELLLRKGGFHIQQTATGNFTDEAGIVHKIEFHTRSLLNIVLPVTVYIDNEMVYSGTCPIRGLLKAILIYFPIGFLLGTLLSSLAGFITISWNIAF